VVKNILTDLNFLQIGQSWPPDDIDTRERLKMYNTNRLLFKGKHDQVYTDWVRLLRDDQQATMEIIINWHKRLSKLFADLLLGEPPRIIAGDVGTPEQINLDRIIEDNNFIMEAYKVALDTSRFADGLFKIRYDDNRAIIEVNSPAVWFPVVNPFNVSDIKNHVLAWTYKVNKTDYLRAEIHYKGKIQTNTYILQKDKISELVESTTQETGINDFLIVRVSNLITSEDVTGNDDYTDIDSIIQEIEIRFSQISRILDKHSDPNMCGPSSALEIDPTTGQYSFRGSNKYFPVESKDDIIPQYIVWEGHLDAGFKQIDYLIEQLYFLSETSAAAYGNLKQGLAESGSALKRLLLAPLAKVNRIRLSFDPQIKKVLKLASALEVAQSKPGAIKLSNIFISWRDGLPEDDGEKTTIETQRYGAGLSSLESSIRRLDGLEGQQLDSEVDKINAEKQASSVEPPKITLPNSGSVV